jgi:drug/metabolite transporter (DMT)-like permease
VKDEGSGRGGILLVTSSTVIIAFAQVFLKLGSASVDFTFRGTFLNFWLIAGLLLYLVATLLLVLGLRHGALSTLYPLLGLSYIWVCVLSFFIFHETITQTNAFGVLLIIMGVGLMGTAGNRHRAQKKMRKEVHRDV